MTGPIIIVPGKPAPRRWLVTGAGGQLGADLVELLSAEPSVILTAVDRGALDVTDAAAVAEAVAGHDIVVNAAAWTNVDAAETHEAEATAVNGHGAENLARACAAIGARMYQVSTDYVFPGDATAPIPEDAPTDPINAYGRSKLVGEQAVLKHLPTHGYVLRTAWLYGATGKNFVKTMLRLAGERETLTVIDDQRGQPTWSGALARQIFALAANPEAPAGVYHATASGETTWNGFARAVFELAGLDPERVLPVSSAEYVTPAKRPAYSVLGHGRWAEAGVPEMADWRDMLVESGVVAAAE